MIETFIISFFKELFTLTNEMTPYLLLGFFIAGLLQVFFPEQSVNKMFGTNKLYSSIKAALLGIPLPLCSCGVIPAGIALHKNGASKGSTLSFLISTPQTGVDSMLVTYSLLGLPFAIVRPIVAFFTGVLGGYFANHFEPLPHSKASKNEEQKPTAKMTESTWSKIKNVFHYGFIEFLESIAKWLVIGILLATLIAVLVPDNFFETTHFSPIVQVFIVLLASIPLYICATSSVPLAAVLILKGLSPGAALVLLMAGPATNMATITVILKTLGKKTLFIYLSTIIGGAILGALLIDYVLPVSWFDASQLDTMVRHQHGLSFFWKISSSSILVSLLFFVLLKPYFKKWFNTKNIDIMSKNICEVEGINCNHCKSSIEKDLSGLPFIKTVEVNVQSGEVLLDGEDIDFKKVEEHINSLGFKYKGKKE